MSKRRKIAAGNWKMNLTAAEASQLVSDIVKGSSGTDRVEKILLPAFPFIDRAFKGAEGSGILIGAQDCSERDKGAFTGEVSAAMLASAGCKYVLVGHSERRNYFKETDQQMTEKIKRILEKRMNPIFCFGEQISERKSGKHFDVVGDQLHEVLKHFDHDQLHGMILAYEPVWAIGTGVTAKPEQAQEMHEYVRKAATEMIDAEFAEQIPILYGGSCNAENAPAIFSCKDVDGGLIGGASLRAEEFCKIIRSFK